MTSVWYLCKRQSCKDFLVDLVKDKVDASEFVDVDVSKFYVRFVDHWRAPDSRPLLLVVDIFHTKAIDLLIQLLNAHRSKKLHSLKIIVLSTFITWGGKKYSSPITNASGEFKKRHPFSNTFELFYLENVLVEMAGRGRGRFKLSVVGMGLLYGGKGYDLFDAFDTICSYTGSNEKIAHLFHHARNRIPITNCRAVVDVILRLHNDEEDLPPYIPIVDSSTTSLLRTFNALDARTNSLSESRLTAGSLTIEMLQDDLQCLIWMCDLPFNSGHLEEISLARTPDLVWGDYLSSNGYSPISMLITGPPKMRKTDTAKRVAERLSLQVVNTEFAVKSLLQISKSALQPSPAADFVRATMKELSVAIHAKLNEGKKPAKGAPVMNSGELPVDAAMITTAFCQNLSLDLVWKCFAICTTFHSGCQRRGYILDAWDGRVINDLDSLRSALNYVPKATGPSGSKAPDVEAEIVLELQCPSNTPMERLVASLGPQAIKSKDSQALVKALEVSMATYNTNIVKLNVESTGTEPAHTLLGHKGVVEIEGAMKQGSIIVRVDTLKHDAKLVDEVLSIVYKKRNYKIGWLPDIVDPNPVAVADVVTTSAVLENVSTEQTSQPKPKLDEEKVAPPVERQAGLTIIAEVEQLDESKIELLKKKVDKIQEFLSETVLPHLARGLITIRRDKPADPVKWLADELHKQSIHERETAVVEAQVRYTSMQV